MKYKSPCSLVYTDAAAREVPNRGGAIKPVFLVSVIRHNKCQYTPIPKQEKDMPVKIVPKAELLNIAGTRLEPGEWVTLDQDRINVFADCTEDHQFIHIDEEAARNTPFGSTIAHGFLTLSMLTRMVQGQGVVPENVVMGLNYGFDKVRFLAPVKAGKRVRAHQEVVNVDQKDDNRFLIKNAITVEIEGEETPALVAEWLTMVITG
jgi:acyl dehydratase